MTTANPSYKPSEVKREEFRKYLEKHGVMDALTRVLVSLYEEVEKPDDALEYIREKLFLMAKLQTYKQLQTKLMEAEDRIKELESQLQGLTVTEEPDVNAAADGTPEPPGEDAVKKEEDASPEEKPEES